MVKLQGTTITMTRGDTARVQIGITDVDGSEYKPLNGDKVRFAAKKSYYDEQPVILKEIPISTLLLSFTFAAEIKRSCTHIITSRSAPAPAA